MILLLPIISIVAGFIFIYLSADSFTDNSARIASIYKVSPLLIGILILGFGTSAPEIIVSALAAFENHPELAIGNAFGSNIFNIALVLGITAIIKPIEIKWQAIKKEWRVLLGFMLIAGFLLWNKSDLSFFDGSILLGLLVAFLVYTYYISKKVHHEFDNLPSNIDSSQKWRIWRNLIISLTILLVSAQFIVFGGINIAKYFGVPDLIIGITLVALGTSIPELAVSLRGVFKNQHEMVVGNIIGSNIFNTVAVLAIPALISTSAIPVPKELFYRDSIFMLVLTLLLGLSISRSLSGKRKNQISQFEGGGFIGILCIYLYLLFWWN
jgi:cation:H+ antiporter